MFCTNCGTPLSDDNQFCPQCGKQLVQQMGSEPLLRRALLFVEENEWGKADDYCEQVLDQDPENAQAYVIKLMIRTQVKNEEDLAQAKESYADWSSYQNACRFADEALREKLQGYLRSTEEAIRIREEEARKQEELLKQQAWEKQQAELYAQACRYGHASASRYDLSEAIKRFQKLSDYKDSEARLQSCKQRLEELEKERQRVSAQWAQQERQTNVKRKMFMVLLALVAVAIAVLVICGVNNANSARAQQLQNCLVGMSFQGYYQEASSVTPNGSWGLARSIVKHETAFHFEDSISVAIDTTTSYDDGAFTTVNGNRQWDRVDRQSRTVYGWEVNVSLFGRVNVIIDGVRYQLNVNASDVPVSMENGDVIYKVA